MEDFSIQVGQVSHHEDKDGLYDPHLVRESGNKACGKAPNHPYNSAAHSHHQEGAQASKDVGVQDVGGTHLRVGLKHMVQDYSHGVV